MLKDLEGKTGGTTVKHLGKVDVENIRLRLPPLDKQVEIAALLDAVEDLGDLASEKQGALEDLSASLIRRIKRPGQ